MKAISIWQPWASLIAIGAKQIETRSWATGYRGLLVIHAAKRWEHEEQREACASNAIFQALALADLDPQALRRRELDAALAARRDVDDGEDGHPRVELQQRV